MKIKTIFLKQNVIFDKARQRLLFLLICGLKFPVNPIWRENIKRGKSSEKLVIYSARPVRSERPEDSTLFTNLCFQLLQQSDLSATN
jgi:hypothetical protein